MNDTAKAAAAIEITGLSFTYPLSRHPALRGIDLTVAPGEWVSIIGANGAGKSTLAQAIRGLVPQFSKGELDGTVRVRGRDLAGGSVGELTADVGYVFQNPFTQMTGVATTVYAELAYGLGNMGVPPEAIRSRVDAMLEATNLVPLAARSPFELSGGQQQRVALASILVMEQPILVIDEPTSQLDPETTAAMFELIATAHAAGRTVVLVEHKMEQVARFSDRVILLSDGEIALSGTPAEVFSNPACERYGVRLPEAMYLERALERRGFVLPGRALSVTELAGQLQKLGAHPVGAGEPAEIPDTTTVAKPAEPEPVIIRKPLNGEPLVEIDNVSFTYPGGVEAVHEVSLALSAGESVAIIGQNGAGKTTLAKLVNGLLRPSSGEVRIAGHATTEWTAAETARRVGYVFQNPDDQIFNKTVLDEVEYALRRLGLPEVERKRRVDAALELTGLSDRRSANPYDLPLSVRKFVTIASVIALDTAVLLFDEPTAGQDLAGLNRLIAILRELSRRGKAVVTITHDMEFVSQHFARTIVMADRQVLADTPTERTFYLDAVIAKAMVNQPAFVQLTRHFCASDIGLSMDKLADVIAQSGANTG
ncbi:MAG: ATP-binding cassette domain-containing protein [Propionibacteriaceae bacterium]|jgi:energy-coupling factor transport system ATP-binding protein|nr:ATP-binding cassette domain-containing protein [Propionibacteriaceae bacterium]